MLGGDRGERDTITITHGGDSGGGNVWQLVGSSLGVKPRR